MRWILVAAILFSGNMALAADADCSHLKSDFSVSSSGPKDGWQGKTVLISLGAEQIVGALSVHQDLLSIQFFPDGSYTGYESGEFTSLAGSFQFEDWYRVEPTDSPDKLQFKAEGNILTGGTGRFESAFGRLKIHGTITPAFNGGGTADLKATGSVCTLN